MFLLTKTNQILLNCSVSLLQLDTLRKFPKYVNKRRRFDICILRLLLKDILFSLYGRGRRMPPPEDAGAHQGRIRRNRRQERLEVSAAFMLLARYIRKCNRPSPRLT